MFRQRRQKTQTGIDAQDTLYVPMKKHYVFNETGNLMLFSTNSNISDFNEGIKDSFIDVSVIFAAISKALGGTQNPLTKKPYTLYNYQAVKSILSSSNMFIEQNVEEREFCSVSVGSSLGKELVQQILNRSFSESELKFTPSFFNGMSYQQKQRNEIERQRSLNDSESNLFRCGNLFFVCETLMGLPQTSAILVTIEPQSIENLNNGINPSFQDINVLGEKDSSKHISKNIVRRWWYKKRTYLFIPPKYFTKNTSSFGIINSPEFENLIESMKSSLLL